MAPKYQQVADTLRADILDGVYQKRMLLPTEQLLCQQFQVSRQTVRQALAELVSEGPDRAPAGQRLSHPGTCPSPPLCPGVLWPWSPPISVTTSPQHPAGGGKRSLRPQQRPPALCHPESGVQRAEGAQYPAGAVPPDGVLVEGTKTGLPNPNLDLYRRLMTGGFPWSL